MAWVGEWGWCGGGGGEGVYAGGSWGRGGSGYGGEVIEEDDVGDGVDDGGLESFADGFGIFGVVGDLVHAGIEPEAAGFAADEDGERVGGFGESGSPGEEFGFIADPDFGGVLFCAGVPVEADAEGEDCLLAVDGEVGR
ncbi:MAG: hypothetical protein RI897_4068 [Verrucomicrobiota bacterium]